MRATATDGIAEAGAFITRELAVAVSTSVFDRSHFGTLYARDSGYSRSSASSSETACSCARVEHDHRLWNIACQRQIGRSTSLLVLRQCLRCSTERAIPPVNRARNRTVAPTAR